MLRITFAALVACFAAVVFAVAQDSVTGSGKSVTIKRELPAFTGVEIRTSGKLEVTVGKAAPIEITADDNIAPLIKTEVTGGILLITSDKSFNTKGDLKFSVGVADLKSLAILGSANANIAGVSGDELALDISGSGDATVAGKTERLTVNVKGSGDVKALKLASRNATVSIAGSGDVEVSASEALTASIMGSGDVKYAGSPKVTKNITGSGDVKQVKSDKKD